VVNDSLITYTNVLDYVKVRVAGLEVKRLAGFEVNKNDSPQVNWRRKGTALFLDEVRVEVETLDNVSIRDVAFIKAFRPPFFGVTGGGGAGGGARDARFLRPADPQSAEPALATRASCPRARGSRAPSSACREASAPWCDRSAGDWPRPRAPARDAPYPCGSS